MKWLKSLFEEKSHKKNLVLLVNQTDHIGTLQGKQIILNRFFDDLENVPQVCADLRNSNDSCSTTDSVFADGNMTKRDKYETEQMVILQALDTGRL